MTGSALESLVSLAQSRLQFTDSVDDLILLVNRMLNEIDKAQANERTGILGSVLTHVLTAMAKVAIAGAKCGAVLARRVAGLPSRNDIATHHVWLIEGELPVAIVESSDGAARTIELPALADWELLQEIILNHAEEHEDYYDPKELRQRMSKAVGPLRNVVAEFESPFTVHAFGRLKHLPLAALTGKGSILAKHPTCKILSHGGKGQAGRADRSGRFAIVDCELAQSETLKGLAQSDVRTYNSGLCDRSVGAGAAFDALVRTAAREVLFFGHGYVDQFHLGHVGLITDKSCDPPAFMPSTAIRQMDLSGVELALIMACGAGQGNVFLEPSLSVGHAFRLAGVKHVIAPQWPILAEHALDFTNRYLKLINSGTEYVEAWSTLLGQDPNRFISIALFGDSLPPQTAGLPTDTSLPLGASHSPDCC